MTVERHTLTRNCILFMLKVLELRMWSANRPGVATTTCGWLVSSKAWVTMSARDTSRSKSAQEETGLKRKCEAM